MFAEKPTTMDLEIFNSVFSVSHKGLTKMDPKRKQLTLWKRVVDSWNKTHIPTKATLEGLIDELHMRWPQMYTSLTEKSLYCSFSYVDYFFEQSPEGGLCGGIFLRESKLPHQSLNMSATQIADLMGLFRREPLASRYVKEEMHEVIDLQIEYLCGERRETEMAIMWYDRAMSLFRFNRFEDALLCCQNSILYKNIAQDSQEIACVVAEDNTIMGYCYYYTY